MKFILLDIAIIFHLYHISLAMGVSKLWNVVNYLELNNDHFVNNLTGIYAVDASQIIYKAIRTNKLHYVGDDINNHVMYVFNMIFNCLTRGVYTIWVFDGKCSELKSDTIKKRLDEKNKYKSILHTDDTLDINEQEELFKKSYSLKNKHIRQVKNLLDLLGIPHIQAIGESEILCSKLNKEGIVNGVISDDWDAVLYGSSIVLKNFTSDMKHIKLFDTKKLFKLFNLTEEQFIEFCILLGTDYNPGIDNIQPVELYKLFLKHKNFTDTLDNLISEGFYVPNDYLKLVLKVKDSYILDPTDVEIPEMNYQWLKPDCNELLSFLCDDYGLDRKIIDDKLSKIYNMYIRYNRRYNRKN